MYWNPMQKMDFVLEYGWIVTLDVLKLKKTKSDASWIVTLDVLKSQMVLT